jgi:hypothetical protein
MVATYELPGDEELMDAIQSITYDISVNPASGPDLGVSCHCEPWILMASNCAHSLWVLWPSCWYLPDQCMGVHVCQHVLWPRFVWSWCVVLSAIELSQQGLHLSPVEIGKTLRQLSSSKFCLAQIHCCRHFFFCFPIVHLNYHVIDCKYWYGSQYYSSIWWCVLCDIVGWSMSLHYDGVVQQINYPSMIASIAFDSSITCHTEWYTSIRCLKCLWGSRAWTYTTSYMCGQSEVFLFLWAWVFYLSWDRCR